MKSWALLLTAFAVLAAGCSGGDASTDSQQEEEATKSEAAQNLNISDEEKQNIANAMSDAAGRENR